MDEAGEVCMRSGRQDQPDVGFVGVVAGEVLAHRKQLLVDAVDAEAGPVNHSEGLKHVSKQGVPPDRRVSEDVVGSDSTNEPTRTGDLDPVVVQAYVD